MIFRTNAQDGSNPAASVKPHAPTAAVLSLCEQLTDTKITKYQGQTGTAWIPHDIIFVLALTSP